MCLVSMLLLRRPTCAPHTPFFKKPLGKNVAFGVIAVPNPDYDARHWWSYSEGVREVIGETVAYVYARLFFHPSEPPPVQKAAASDSNTR